MWPHWCENSYSGRRFAEQIALAASFPVKKHGM